MTWFEKLFCGRISAEFDRLEGELNQANDRIQDLEGEVKILTADIAGLKDELGEALTDLEVALKNAEKLGNDVAWYENRVRGLEESLAASITIPDISDLLTGSTPIVEPNLHPELGRVEARKMVYDLEVGDLQYMTWSKDVWLAIIDVMRPFVKKIHGRSEVPINDCENWAASMANFTAHAFRNADLDMQGALFIAWSYKHAYNGFVDLEGKAWIFDPMQTDYMIGELGQNLGEMYETKMIWFT